MTGIRQLASQTAIYGLSTIIGRLLNWLLVPLYTRLFMPAEYGVVNEMFAYVSFLNIVFTYGMETSFFHFSNKEEDQKAVFGTGIFSLIITSLLFALLLIGFSTPIANVIEHPRHPEYISWFALILAFDAVAALPFALLRKQNKALRFAGIKIINILTNIGFNLFFLVVCPKLKEVSFIQAIWSPQIGIGYVFISNLLASGITLLLLLPEILKAQFKPDSGLWKKMIVYAAPLLIAGFAGMINETLDRILLKYLLPDQSHALADLGIYSACYKVSIIMTLFVQTFRFAAEPFFFSHYKNENSKKLYALVMKYFVMTCSLIFLAVMLYMNIIKFFIGEKYWAGLHIVPILLVANMCLGIFYNMSMWYKLTGQTRFGAYFAIFGALVTILFLYILIPIMGYDGAAWATLICYAAMMVFSYITGQKYYKIDYDLKRIFTYIGASLLFWLLAEWIEKITGANSTHTFIINTLLILIFLLFCFITERSKKKANFAG